MTIYMGDLPATVGLSKEYFEQRHIQLDCRGPLAISIESDWGFFVTVLTESHDLTEWETQGIGKVVPRGVTVERRAWIGSCSLLYNCHIGEGAVVAIGSVVRSMEVKPWTMVAGNPARVIARWREGAWQYIAPAKWTVLE